MKETSEMNQGFLSQGNCQLDKTKMHRSHRQNHA